MLRNVSRNRRTVVLVQRELPGVHGARWDLANVNLLSNRVGYSQRTAWIGPLAQKFDQRLAKDPERRMHFGWLMVRWKLFTCVCSELIGDYDLIRQVIVGPEQIKPLHIMGNS